MTQAPQMIRYVCSVPPRHVEENTSGDQAFGVSLFGISEEIASFVLSVDCRGEPVIAFEDNGTVLDGEVCEKVAPLVVVGVPAFNEELSIARIVLLAQRFSDVVIVCDDGSSDLTAAIAERMGADVIRHERNLGYGAAIKSLFERAVELKADVLVTLDGDGQHDPQEIPNVVKPIVQNETDIVIGSRFHDAKGASEMPLYRQVGAKMIAKLVNVSSKDSVKDAQSGFRAYDRKALQQLQVSDAGMGASVQILLDASRQDLKISEVPASCRYDKAGVDTSSENPVVHGASVVASIFRLVLKSKLHWPSVRSMTVLDNKLHSSKS